MFNWNTFYVKCFTYEMFNIWTELINDLFHIWIHFTYEHISHIWTHNFLESIICDMSFTQPINKQWRLSLNDMYLFAFMRHLLCSIIFDQRLSSFVSSHSIIINTLYWLLIMLKPLTSKFLEHWKWPEQTFRI